MLTLVFDVRDREKAKKCINGLPLDWQKIDVLVNNAGIVPENRLFNMSSPEEMRRVFDVNFFATMKLTQLVTKIMIRQKFGSIVNIISISAIDGEPAQVEYVSSKAALMGATKKLASELGNFNIRVNAVAPGVINAGVSEFMALELKKNIANRNIMKRLGEPNEIANVVMFLASDLASYMTSQVIRVDGGM